MENRLKNWGCDTFITDNGIYGLKLLENHHFDLDNGVFFCEPGIYAVAPDTAEHTSKGIVT